MRTTVFCSLNGIFHHLRADLLVLEFFIHAHRFNLCTQSTLVTQRRQKDQMQGPDDLTIQFSHDQFMIWVAGNRFKCLKIRIWQRNFVPFTQASQVIIGQHVDDGCQVCGGSRAETNAHFTDSGWRWMYLLTNQQSASTFRSFSHAYCRPAFTSMLPMPLPSHSDGTPVWVNVIFPSCRI